MIVFLLLVLLVLIVLSAYLIVYQSAHRARTFFAGLPTYSYLPVLGNIHHFLGGSIAAVKKLKEMSEIIEESNLPFVVYAGPLPVIITHDLEDIKKITTTFIEKPYYYNFARVWLGNGLITAPVSIWKSNIKKLAGTFKAFIVDSYQGVFDMQASKLVEKLRSEVEAEPFDALEKYFAYATLETICQTGLGMKDTSGRIVTAEYHRAFHTILELLVQRGVNLLLHPDFVYHLTPMYRQMMKNLNVIQTLSDVAISKRSKERDEMKKNNTTTLNINGNSTKFKPYLDILLDLRESDRTFTDEQIKADVETIIAGGQETTATSLLYLLLMIGCHPEVQEKLYTEMKFIYGDSKRPVEKTDLTQMKYCEAVINETLRLYPPVPVFIRLADRDLKLKSCTVPKGTGCVINIWGVGRSRRVWGPDAKEFRPERWLESNGQRDAGIFLTFSCGRRACIGKKYAMTLLKTYLAHCVRELEFVSDPANLQLKLDITLRPVTGHLLQVRQRK